MKKEILQSSNLKTIKQIEEELIASEVRYRRLFESAKDGILILDAETGMIVDVNPFLINLLGFSKEQFINKAIWELGFFKDIVINKDKFLELQLKEYVRYEDLPLETAEGEKIHVEFVSNVYLANNQKIIQCNIRDITERFHAQEERKKTMKEIEMISRFPSENPNPILRFNNDCILLFANAPALDFISFCGCEIGQVAPLFVYDLIKEVINKGTNQVIEMQFGDKIWLMTFVPLIADGYVNMYCIDITERKKAEDKNLKLFNAVEKTADIIFITDREGIIEYVNPAFESITGYSKEEAIDKTPRILNSGQMELKYFQGLWATILNGEVLYSEMINRKKNGELYFCEQTITPVKNSDGYVTNFISTGKDITERRHAVDSLKLFRSLIDQSNDAIEVLDPETGRFLDVNDKGCSELGYSREEFLALTVFDIDPMVDKSIFKGVGEELQKSGFMMWEGLHRRKDGSTFPVEVNIKYVRLERDYMITVARDITERKRMEESLRESEQKYRQAIENASDIIFTTDINGNILFGNNASLRAAGYSFADFTKMNYLELTLPEYKRKVQSFYMKQFLNKLPTSYIEYPLKNKSGDIIWLGQSANLIFENDQIKGFHLLARDITERKQIEEELKQAYRELENLLNNLDDAIFSVDTVNNKMLSVSIAHENVFGYSQAEFFNNPQLWYEIIVPEDKSIVDAGFPVLMSGKNLHQEFRIIHKDKQIRWIEAKITPTLDINNKLIQIDGIAVNITDRKQAEETIKQNYDFLKNVINSFTNPFYVINVSDRSIVLANTAATDGKNLEMKGYCYSLSHNRNEPCTGENDKCPLMEIIKTREPVVVEHIHFDKDDNARIVEVHGYPIFDENGVVIQMIEYTIDITERKLTEESLKQSEMQLSNALDIALLGHWEYDVIKDEFTFNDHFYKIFHTTVDEVGGYQISSADYARRFVHPEDMKMVGEEIQLAIETTDPNFNSKLEHRILYSDGTIGYITVQFFIIKDSKGKTIKTYGVNQDITVRKKAEEDLRESEERYSTIVNSSPNLIIIHVNYIIRYVNNIGEMLLEYPTEEIIGKSILDFVSEESKPIVIDSMQRRIAGEDVPSYEVTVITKSGAEKSVLIQAKIIQYQKETALLAVVTDITEIKKYERELELSKEKAEEMNRLKSSFLANMSHELRTPMIGILGFSKLLAHSEDADTKETGELIYTSGKRLMDTLNLILDLSRIESGESKLELFDIDLIEEIAETVNLYQVAAKEKNLLLSFSTQYEHLYTRTDKKAIDSILNNLINNAVKYTYKGSITVTVAKEMMESENWALIEVTDTGIGIEEKNTNMIFREFRQVSEGLERSFDGTGLGLTLTKKYTELIGGTIAVKSKINEGSIFTVSFPIVPVEFENAELPADEEIIQNVIQKEIIHKKNILIVEDDKVTIIYVTRILKDKYIIDTAMNSMEAIDKAEKKQYDLILMDINLGRSRNGIYTTNEIRKMDNYKDTPIIAMTAFAMKGDKEDFLEGGCSYYISKPFEADDLIALIEIAIERKMTV